MHTCPCISPPDPDQRRSLPNLQPKRVRDASYRPRPQVRVTTRARLPQTRPSAGRSFPDGIRRGGGGSFPKRVCGEGAPSLNASLGNQPQPTNDCGAQVNTFSRARLSPILLLFSFSFHLQSTTILSLDSTTFCRKTHLIHQQQLLFLCLARYHFSTINISATCTTQARGSFLCWAPSSWGCSGFSAL